MASNGAPGTAVLYEMIQELQERFLAISGKRRAMLLSFVDEDERFCGYGDNGKQPRTAQIRAFWKECGEPDLGG